MSRVGAIAVLLLMGTVTASMAADRYDPRFRFRTLRTPHFSIHFHQGEEAAARRLAAIAEEVAARVAPQIGRANGRVHVIVVDQNDLSNGWAIPTPYNIIEITMAAPPGASAIGNTDDWLRLVFSHEYTHIVHLDKARGWIGGLRRVFGRAPLLYPNLFMPLWQIEGLATYNESLLTGEGRVRSADFRFILERAAAERRFEPLDRANGGLVDWPAGAAQYAYGAYFHQYLADKYGADSIGRLADETSGHVPYFGTRAFKKVFGRSLGGLWDDFEADFSKRAAPDSASRTRLTRHGFTVGAPALDATGGLFYSVVNPHGFPALMEWPKGAAKPRRLADKFLGNRIAVARSMLVFDQIEIARNVALRSDLYALDLSGGSGWRLTKDARAADPDVSPDGATIVCTVQSIAGRALATMRMPAHGELATPAALVAESGTDFNAPRWSPDGRWIAAERRRLGGPAEIVIVDVATRAVRSLVSSSEGRNITPFWTSDGRAILFASDRDDEPFSIYSADVSTGALRRLENTGVSAQHPVVSADGRDLVFVGYTAAGYDLFSMPLASARWRAVDSRVPPPPARAVDSPATGLSPAGSYRPWRTLLPQFWMPIVESSDGEFAAGAETAGADALGRHAYGAAATWTTARARPDWSVSYAYDRWWPTLFASTSDTTDPWRDGDVRTREVTAGALFAVRRVRSTHFTLAAFDASTDDFDCVECPKPLAGTVARRALHFGWSFSNARSYGYSVSRESGTAFRTTVETAPQAFGSDATTGAIAADARAYLPAWPRHGAVAFRAAGASAWGDERRRRVFSASGAGPQTDDFDVGTGAVGLLRGIGSADAVGEHAAIANVDYRFPIRYVQRGIGTLPLFFRSIHGAVFADAGHAWTGSFNHSELRRSVGAELSVDTVVGYSLPLTFTSGVAFRVDPVNDRRGAVAFARVGRAF